MKKDILKIEIIGTVVFALITHISFSQNPIKISGRIIDAEKKNLFLMLISVCRVNT